MPRRTLDQIISDRVDRAFAPVRRRVAAAVADLAATRDNGARDAAVQAAIDSRQIRASEREVWAAHYEAAPVLVTRVLAALPAGAVPEPEPEIDPEFWALIQPGVRRSDE